MKKLLCFWICLVYIIVLCYSCTNLSSKIAKAETISPVNSFSSAEDQNSYDVTDEGIIKINKNTHKSETIYFQKGINCIVNYNNKVYFVVDDKIMSIDTYGRNKTLELDGKDINSQWYCEISSIELYNNMFYIWTSGTSIAQFDPETKKVNSFLDDVSEIEFHDEYAYYIDHAERTFSLYRMNIQTRKVELLRGNGITKERDKMITGIWVDNLIFINKQLYYATRNPNCIYEYQENGKDVEIYLSKEWIECLSYYGDDLLFVTTTDKDNLFNLYRYDRDSNKVLFIYKLTDFDLTQGIHVDNGYGYYNNHYGDVIKIKIK